MFRLETRTMKIKELDRIEKIPEIKIVKILIMNCDHLVDVN